MNTTPPQPVKPSAEQSRPPSEAATDQFTVSPGASSGTIGTPFPPSGAGLTTPLERIGDFTILRILGEGGMGTVYLAEDSRLRRKAAIKTMKLELAAKPENRERFLREAQAAAAIEHDNVVPIWHVGEATDGSPFIAMPFLQGEMLESRVKREPIPNLGIILKVAREVAEGLAAAHARGLIHRDIKPSNIWIEGDLESRDLAQQVRRCKILDFGLARSAAIADVHLTASGMILGTPAYMAPEQADGDKVDHRADLFSLGVMLYRMSTGQLPFAGSNTMSILIALATVNPPSARTLNRSLPQSLSDLIDRLLCKDLAGRPQSAAEVAATVHQIVKDLQAKTSDETIQAQPEPVPRPATSAKRSRTPLLVTLGLLALLPLGWWLATILLRVETDKGTLIVEINDDEVAARIKNGKLILTGPDDKVRYTLAPSERDKKIDAGPYKVRVEGADGLTLDTRDFTLKKNGKVTVRVTVDPRAVAKRLNPDRKAAEYVLSIGGMVRVDEKDRDVKALAELPGGGFRLTWIILADNKHVSDAGLASFKDCKSLTVLNLSGTQVSDAGLAYFDSCKNLTELDLNRTQVGDAGLAHFKGCDKIQYLGLMNTKVSDSGLACFKDCKDLTHLVLGGCSKVSDGGLAHFKSCNTLTLLNLGGTKVSDAGLAYFKQCEDLDILWLWGTRVGDAGLACFKDCKKLEELNLSDTKVSDAGLAYFKGCKNLTELNLSDTKVSDAGLAHFKGCKKLTNLDLSDTQVGDAGITQFKQCKTLKQLNLQETKVSAAKIEQLKKALPKCKIASDEM